ncbi:MAG: hypothetical protein V7767_00020 [Leeuwenhoekiella sp.]
MAQDIRDLMKKDLGVPRESLKAGHEKRFEAKLNASLGFEQKQKTNNYLWLKIAAVLVVIIAVGGFLLNNPLQQQTSPVVTTTADNTQEENVQLSDLSPQFKQVEDYYLASINVELAQLQITSENKALIDSFMTQLEELNNEYKRLNSDLVEVGVNEDTVAALIDNLKLRLDLLFKLKDKLTELKQHRDSDTEPNTV